MRSICRSRLNCTTASSGSSIFSVLQHRRNNSNNSGRSINRFHSSSRSILKGAAYASSLAYLTLFRSSLVSSFPIHRHRHNTNTDTDTLKYHTGRLNMSTRTFTTHRDSGLITVTPQNESTQSGLVLICHGLGDSSEGFLPVAETLAARLPHLKLILPTAPTKPVTMNMGMPMPSWYDIKGLDERSNESCEGIEESRGTLTEIMRREHEETGLGYDRMVLAGFSQGGALSLYTGMQMPEAAQKLAGVVVLSGYLPSAKKFVITPGLESTPILHCHGEADPMVRVDMARRSKEVVTGEKGAKEYELKTYPGLVHSVNEEEVGEVLAFLGRVLPDDEGCRVRLKEPEEMGVKELRAAVKKAGLGRRAVGFMEKGEFVRLLRDYRDGKL